MNNRTKGAIALILSSIAFTLMAVMVKLTGGRVPLMEQVFIRNAIMMIISGTIIYRQGLSFIGAKESRKYILMRCLFGFGGVVASFYANRNLLLGDAQALHKLSPFFVTILAVLFLGERINITRIVTLIFAFLGALLIINPQFNSDIFPALIGLMGAFFAGAAYATISYILRKGQKESGQTIIFMFSVVSCILSFPFMMGNFVVPDLVLGIQLLGIGIFAALGQYFITTAYGLTEASGISIFNYLGVIFAALFGKLFFGENLGLMSILGIAIIIFSGLITFLENNRIMQRSKRDF